MKTFKTVLLFLVGFGFAFGLSMVLGTIGPTPTPVLFLLLVVAAIWNRAPKLQPMVGQAAALYGSVFLLLWFLTSEMTPGGVLAHQLVHVSRYVLAFFVFLASVLFMVGLKKDPMPRGLLKWFLLLCLMGWILAFVSGSAGGAGSMRDLLMHWFGLSRHAVDVLVPVLRKCIHFLFYGALAVVAFRTMLQGGTVRSRAVGLAAGYALAHACFDEYRQMTAAGRTASGWDVALDMAGAAVMLALAGGFRRGQKS